MIEPVSFEDLVNNYTNKQLYKGVWKNIATIPIYVVNKVTGTFTIVEKAEVLTGKDVTDYTLCEIKPMPYNTIRNKHMFSILLEEKNKDKLVDIVWGSFYAGNYELFLHKKEAALKAINILQNKRKKLNENLEKLYEIVY